MSKDEKINIKWLYALFVFAYLWLMVMQHILFKINSWGSMPLIISILGSIIIIAIIYQIGKRITSKKCLDALNASRGKVQIATVIFCILISIKTSYSYSSAHSMVIYSVTRGFITHSLLFLGLCLYLQMIVINAQEKHKNPNTFDEES